MKDTEEKNLKNTKILRGLRCAVLGKCFNAILNNSNPESADVVVVQDSIFFKYDTEVERWQSNGKVVAVCLSSQSSYEEEAMKFVNEYGITVFIDENLPLEEITRVFSDATGKKAFFADVSEPPEFVKRDVPEKEIQGIPPEEKTKEEDFISTYNSRIQHFELPALPPVLLSASVTIEKKREQWFSERVERLQKKVRIIKFAKEKHYPVIPLPLPGGQYEIFALSETSGEAMSLSKLRAILRAEIIEEMEEKAKEERERREAVAERIRERKLAEIDYVKESVSQFPIFPLPPFEGFERCIGIVGEKGTGSVVMLIGQALHNVYPDKKVVINGTDFGIKGEEVIDVNFKISSNEEGDYVIRRAGGVNIKVKDKGNDLVLSVGKGKKIVIKDFFPLKRLSVAYFRNKDEFDALVKDIDNNLKSFIMKKEKENEGRGNPEGN